MKVKVSQLIANMTLGFKIAETCNIYNVVVNSFKRAGFDMVNGNNWNVMWTNKVRTDDVRELNRFQKINHFPGSS
jgi:hypothetical protein